MNSLQSIPRDSYDLPAESVICDCMYFALANVRQSVFISVMWPMGRSRPLRLVSTKANFPQDGNGQESFFCLVSSRSELIKLSVCSCPEESFPKWKPHGNTGKRFPAFFSIVSSNELVVLDSLENSKQYKNAGKRFRVFGALRLCAHGVVFVAFSFVF